ncbi:hypothetical protein [Sutterella sp.]|uniref:hypothetical protein n=1 Tax=Sutterella sp. TaxID=1981025 RepID=UPI0026DFC583|nr:hypothetical protein [Sutterella sp.]MDO5532964.1 hypothetical protein [Sutterella sp.]
MEKAFNGKDLTGQRFGRLVVEGFSHTVRREHLNPDGSAGKPSYAYYWHCLCDCGNRTTVSSGCLTTGTTRSCGCLRRGGRRSRVTGGRAPTDRQQAWRIWYAIMRKCEIPGAPGWNNCGAKGIRLCDEWKVFEGFDAWLAENDWAPGKRLWRRDLSVGWSPANCYLATPEEERALHTGQYRSEHPLYAYWHNLRQRCENKRHGAYANTGALGVRLCEEWLDFDAFFAWCVAQQWRKGLYVVRKDCTKDFSPENCMLSEQKENAWRRKRRVFPDEEE